MARILTLIATGAALAACTAGGQAGSPGVGGGARPPVEDGAPMRRPGAPSTGCNAEAAGFALGQAYTPELGAEALRASGARTVRALPPGIAVTMEFDPNRLNLVLDEARRVVRVHCG